MRRHPLRPARLLLAGSMGAAIAVACSSARYGVSQNGTGGPSVSFPASFAEGNTGKAAADAGAPPSAAAPEPTASAGANPPAKVAPAATPASPSTLPDPEPLYTADHWEYVFDYVKGAVRVASVRPVRFASPVPTARRIGRFAVEIYIGRELIDRVRFEFPLLAADPPPPGPKRSPREAPRFALGAETSQTVLVPASDRATAAKLVDRLTGDTWPLDWPPAANAPALLTPH